MQADVCSEGKRLHSPDGRGAWQLPSTCLLTVSVPPSPQFHWSSMVLRLWSRDTLPPKFAWPEHVKSPWDAAPPRTSGIFTFVLSLFS